MADTELQLDALLALGYGLYIVGSHSGNRLSGQISNAVMQITDTPPRLAAAINAGSLTNEYVRDSGVFSVNVLAESAPMTLIRLFGFRSGRDTDKFAQVAHEIGPTGCPLLREHAVVCVEARVTKTIDCQTHTVFIGDVVSARIAGHGRPMTYAYYREVLRGKTPPTAPTYVAPPVADKTRKEPSKMSKYVCNVCGYVYDPAVGDPDSGVEPGTAFEDLPDDWICPECGAGKDEFEKVE